jgi:hypothetical protein
MQPEPEPKPEPKPQAPVVMTPDRSSFSPSMQLSSPASTAMMQQARSTSDSTLVDVVLEQQRLMLAREDKTRQDLETKAEMKQNELRKEMQQQMEQLREDLTPKAPVAAITEAQLEALQSRLEALHAAKLLDEVTLFALEDCLADFIDATAACGIVTAEVVSSPSAASCHPASSPSQPSVLAFSAPYACAPPA